MFQRKPLHIAVSNVYDDPEEVETLIDQDADVNAQDSLGYTPLHLATIYHNRKIVDVLLKCGADVNSKACMGRSPLHYAAFYSSSLGLLQYDNDLLIIRSLLQNGADINSLTNTHETPLMLAVKGCRQGIVKELLEWGANVHIRDNLFQTCLHIISGTSDRSILMELLKHGACVQCFDQNDKTALDIILQSGSPQKLVEAKAFIKAAILVNKGHWAEFALAEENDDLRKFMHECFEEVNRMRSIQCSKAFSLCDFALRSDNVTDYNSQTEKDVLDKVLNTLTIQTFPNYNDFLEARFQRSYMCEKLSGMNVYARCETAEVFLNSDIIDRLSSFLPKEDLFRFLKTLTESTCLNRK